MVTMRWAVRLIGLGSTVVLARLLTPDDFGVVATGTLFIGLLMMFTELGTSQLLIRIDAPEPEHYYTAWTIMLCQSLLLAILLFALAPLAAIYFDEPRAIVVIRLIACSQILAGLQNVATIDFRRELDFRRDFMFGVYDKLSGTIPTIGFAFYFRSYWALVWGILVGQAIQVVVGYWMRPFRPRLSLRKWREFFSYSVWITPANIASFLNGKADVFVVGAIASTAQMGAYNVASELASMATGEVVMPMARALYPNYALLKNRREEFSRVFITVVKTVGIISFSFGLGFAAVASDVVNIVFGDQWLSVIPLVEWLAIFGAFAAIQYTLSSHVFISMGAERAVFYINWSRLFVFAASVVLAGRFGGVQAVAVAATLSTAAFTFVPVVVLRRVLSIPSSELVRAILRPLCAGILMFAAVKMLHVDSISSHFVTLALDVLVGAATFVGLIFASWIFLGRPDGPEERVVDFVARNFGVGRDAA